MVEWDLMGFYGILPQYLAISMAKMMINHGILGCKLRQAHISGARENGLEDFKYVVSERSANGLSSC